MSIHFSPFSSEFLEKLLEQIKVTQTQYELAQRAYRSLGKWLERPQSVLRQRDPNVYIQGSFRLGTAVRPSSPDDDLDIDVVCEIKGSKAEDTQKLVKKFVGYEERWSQDFGPAVKMDRLTRKTIQNDETKKPFARFQSQSCA